MSGKDSRKLKEKLKGYRILDDDSIKWLAERFSPLATTGYVPDSIYLGFDLKCYKTVKVVEVIKGKQIEEEHIQLPIVNPVKLYLFETKTSEPTCTRAYTQSQRHFLKEFERNPYRADTEFYVLHVPLGNFIPQKETEFEVRVYKHE